ncbi:MAG: hypothetical protein A2Z27_04400 [candidate division Zixibacteria bacterium RBG_16_50_21]|nr:MAG: hypothetical protein A2Z27_04400 [candidate division Zixibacteria bacterium RBG_16_50_21]
MKARDFHSIWVVSVLLVCLQAEVLAIGVYETWVARFNGEANGTDRAFALAVDQQGNVYVTGSSAGVNSNLDYLTIKYSPAGETLWTRRYDGGARDADRPFAIAIDQQGNVIVGGEATVSGAGTFDFLTIKYSSGGDILWFKIYNGPEGSFDEINDLTVDDSGNVYVTGNSWGLGSANDYVTIKYSPSGESLWLNRLNGEGNSHDIPWAITVDDSQNVFVTGYGPGLVTGNDYLTVKYSPRGDTLWARRFNLFGNSDDPAWGLDVDVSGNVLVTGNSGTVKYGPNGESLWGRTEIAGIEVKVDDFGYVYVVSPSATSKVSASGQLVWSKSWGGTDLALDKDGNTFICGETEFYRSIGYTPQGETLWLKIYQGPGNTTDGPEDIAVDDFGNVYVTGGSVGDNTGNDFATIKYSPCFAIPADLNISRNVTLGDVVHLVNYIFDRDKPPCLGVDPGNCWEFSPSCRGDVNYSGAINLGDVIHLINFLFDRDKPPCLGSDPGNCWTPVANGACCLAVP